eukprot:NODE_895_length_3353_cov_0.338045.p2 type:complete len:234 gc:universal NODE_895_length_3353_cov_0.338045:1988-2689(+)
MLLKDMYLELIKNLPMNHQLYMFDHYRIAQIGKKIKRAGTKEEKKHFENLYEVKKQYDIYKKWDNKHRKVVYIDRRIYKKLYAASVELHGEDHPETIEAKCGLVYTYQFPRDQKYILLSQKGEKEAIKMEVYAEIKERVLSGELQPFPIKVELETPGKMPKFINRSTPEERAKKKAAKKLKKQEKLEMAGKLTLEEKLAIEASKIKRNQERKERKEKKRLEKEASGVIAQVNN